jgi:hypothetical protein
MYAINFFFTIVMYKLLLKTRHRDIINYGDIIYCITHHVFPEITVGKKQMCSVW